MNIRLDKKETSHCVPAHTLNHSLFSSVQFGYDESARPMVKIKAMEAWVRDNIPASDDEPGHPDIAILFTRSGPRDWT